jgi:branched-chain amino acid transport system permease protein
MGGVYTMWGAVIAALLMQLLPGWLQSLGVNYAWLTILFGVGVLQVITTAPAGIADQFPKDMKRLGRLLWRLVRRPATPAPGASGATEGGGT